MSDPENSQGQSSSSNEENATAKEPELSEPSSNMESTKKLDHVDSTASLTTGTAQEKSEEGKDESAAFLSEITEQTCTTKVNVDSPTKATVDPLLQDNTNIPNLSK